MKKFILITFFFLILVLSSFCEIFTVKQDGSGNFTSIQPAILAAQEGDTVLVYPGTYFENLYLVGRNITLASLYLMTGEDSYRYNTIIDGNHAGRVLRIIYGENLNTVICGLTIQNGYKKHNGGAGIYIYESSPKLMKCIVQYNECQGGAISCSISNSYLSGNTIRYNYCIGFTAGNYEFAFTMPIFDSINLNSVYLNYGHRMMDIGIGSEYNYPITIKLDTATVSYYDPYFITSNDVLGFPYNNLTLHINHGIIEPVASSLYVSPEGDDKNDGLSFESPLKTISFALKLILPDSNIHRNIYLENGTYSRTITGEPLPLTPRSNISIIGQDSETTLIDGDHKFYLLYGPNLTHNYLFKNFTFQHGSDSTFSWLPGIVTNFNSNFRFENFTIKNSSCFNLTQPFFSSMFSDNLIIRNFNAYNNTGGIIFNMGSHLDNKPFLLENCHFHHNIPGPSYNEGEGGLIGASLKNGQTMNIINSCFTNNLKNQDPLWGNYTSLVGIGNTEDMGYGNFNIVNCTFADNQAIIVSQTPGFISTGSNSNISVYNTISRNDNMYEFILNDQFSSEPSVLNVDYSNIQGGTGSIYNAQYNTVNWGAHNINADPLWDTTTAIPYAIPAESPCRNTGTPMYSTGMQPPYNIQQDTLYSLVTPDYDTISLPSTDLRGKARIQEGRIDMGAYEYDPFTGEEEQKLPVAVEVTSVYPNPFYSNVFVSLDIKKPGYLKAEIYDLQGHYLTSLADAQFPVGRCSLTWDGKDELGWDVKIGEYLLKISLDGKPLPGAKMVRGKWK